MRHGLRFERGHVAGREDLLQWNEREDENNKTGCDVVNFFHFSLRPSWYCDTP
jgi:hypothetical protein